MRNLKATKENNLIKIRKKCVGGEGRIVLSVWCNIPNFDYLSFKLRFSKNRITVLKKKLTLMNNS